MPDGKLLAEMIHLMLRAPKDHRLKFLDTTSLLFKDMNPSLCEEIILSYAPIIPLDAPSLFEKVEVKKRKDALLTLHLFEGSDREEAIEIFKTKATTLPFEMLHVELKKLPPYRRIEAIRKL